MPFECILSQALNLTPQKHAFANQKKCTTTQNKQRKLKPGLVTFYGIWPVNGTGLFSKETTSKGGDKEKMKKKGKVGKHTT